jgi:predicted ABC-type ATPase
MVAGPNGSGKTTLIQTLRASAEISLPAIYINADDLGRQRGLDARAAQQLATSLRLDAIARRQSFLYETVMSHPGKIAELQAAAGAGYAITVVFVATDDPNINIERVALRVADGGHDVPRERIRARHRRSLALAPSAISFAAHAYIYDNTDWGTEGVRQLQAVLIGSRLQPTSAQPAHWIAVLIQRANERAAELEDLHQSVKDRMPLGLPNLKRSVSDGVIAVAGQHFALQIDQASTLALVHDKALLPKPVTQRRSYRIEYTEGVGTVARRATARIRAVASGEK